MHSAFQRFGVERDALNQRAHYAFQARPLGLLQFIGQAAHQFRDLVLGHFLQRLLYRVLAIESFHFFAERAALGFELVDLAQRRGGLVELQGEIHGARHLAVDGNDFGAQILGRIGDRVRLARAMQQRTDEFPRAHILDELIHHGFVNVRHRYPAPGAARRGLQPVVAFTVADPLVASVRDQDPGEQVIRQAAFRARDRFAHVAVFQRVEQGLGDGVGDQRFVRVTLDLPLGARLAFDPADVAMAWRPFIVDVPDGVPGVGERIPLHADQGGLRPGDGQIAAQLRARDAGGAADQVARDERGVIAWFQFRLGDGSAFAHGAGTGVHQAIATRRAAAGTESLSHVFRHTGEAFLFRCDRMHDGEGIHHRIHHDLADGVELGQVAEDDLDALLGTFIAEHMPDIWLTRQSAMVEDQQHIPGAAAAADVGDQLLEGGAVFGFRGFDDVAVFLHDEQFAFTRGSLEVSALRVGTDVVSVFARSNVQCRFFHWWLPGRVSGTARIAPGRRKRDQARRRTATS